MNDLWVAFVIGASCGVLITFIVFFKEILRNTHVIKFFPSRKKSSGSEVPHHVDVATFLDVTHAIEMERKRIGADIHDELATTFSSLHFDLEIISTEAPVLSASSQKRLQSMRGKINTAMESLRRIIYNMMPQSLEKGDLNGAISELCIRYDGFKGAKIVFTSEGEQYVLGDQQKVFVYRIVQELLNNTMKHSHAWRIEVALCWHPNTLKVIVKDDGRGVNGHSRNTEGYGINGIFARARAIGAIAKFNQPAKGTEFELVLPMDTESVERI